MDQRMRVVGKPKGVEVLYIEDYVYSFMRFAILEKKYKQMEVILLGDEKTENQRHYYYVSGMVFEEKELTQFEGLKRLGSAIITYSQEEYLEISLRCKKDKSIDFNAYYIYYQENDRMKNYMLSFIAESRENKDSYENEPIEISCACRPSPEGLGMIIKYFIAVCLLAHIIISMNHYCKLEAVGECAIYVLQTISQQTILQEDTFYTP